MIVAATSWPEAAIAIAGIAFVGMIVAVITWQIFATGRTAISGDQEAGYRRLAEDLAAAQEKTTDELLKANEALAQLQLQTRELGERLRELDRVIQTVE